MATNWPSTIPAPLTEEVSIDVGTTAVRRQLQSGRVEVRQFGASPPDMVTLPWKMTPDELAAFHTFYEDTLDNGVGTFTATWLEDLGYTPSSSYEGMIMPYPKESLHFSDNGDFGYAEVECMVAIMEA